MKHYFVKPDNYVEHRDETVSFLCYCGRKVNHGSYFYDYNSYNLCDDAYTYRCADCIARLETPRSEE